MAGVEYLGIDEDEGRQAPAPVAVSKTQAAPAAEVDEQAAADAAASSRRLGQIVEKVRSDSRATRLTDPAVFAADPYGFSEQELEEAWTGMLAHPEYADIVRTRDTKSGVEYLHSEMLITVPYARYMLRSQSNDSVHLIVETTREFSELYPQSISVQFFELEPFNLRRRDILAAVEAIKSDPAYADIKFVAASNDVVYLYSDRYMTEVDAKAHADWVEVDRFIRQ